MERLEGTPRAKKGDPRGSFENSVRAGLALYLKDNPERRPLVAALSGGADSTALAAAMAALRDTGLSLEVRAFHVNHGIRPPESCSADESSARSLCEKLNIPFSAARVPPGAIEDYARRHNTGVEAAARKFRYEALYNEARRLGAEAIVTAHTASDRLETILMAFLRGAGPAGLGALSEFSVTQSAGRDGTDRPRVLRPMLAISRAEVIAYVNARGLSYRNDESNNDERYLRNKVRRILVPFLDEHFPAWRGTALRLGETQALAAAFLAEEAEKRLSWETPSPGAESRAISAERFFSEPEIIREEALFKAIDALAESGAKNPRRGVIRDFVRGSRNAVDLGTLRLENKNRRVTVQKPETAPVKNGFSVLIKKAGVYKLNETTVIAGGTAAAGSELSAQAADAIKALPDEPDFFAALPLALFSSEAGSIFAEDQAGRAALYHAGKLVRKRESVSGCNIGFTLFFNGGSRQNGS